MCRASIRGRSRRRSNASRFARIVDSRAGAAGDVAEGPAVELLGRARLPLVGADRPRRLAADVDLVLDLSAVESHSPRGGSYHPANPMALLAVENVTRRFGGIVALDDVSFASSPARSAG